MGKQKLDKAVYTEVLATTEGEVVTSKTIYKTQSEPDFVKLYIDCVFTVKGVRKGINPIFLAFLEHMSYADVNEENGGQIIYVNKAMKMSIAKKLGLGLDSINKGLSELTKHGLFKRIDVATYQVNPHIVGRGEWKDIKSIQATFNFTAKSCDVIAEIVKNEEAELTTATETLEKQYQRKIKEKNIQTPEYDDTQTTFFDVTNACVDTQAVAAKEDKGGERMIKGLLGYNSQNDRYGLLVMDLWEIEGFHCGETLDIWDYKTKEWIPTKMECHQNEWYLVGTPYSGTALEGLKARVHWKRTPKA